METAEPAKRQGDLAKAEQIYNEILSRTVENNEALLRDQEIAVIRLGEIYRDQKFVAFN
jgi:26S proteasome regulatory subunit RPN6 N-terminal domain